jgi:hypothetical protein
MFSLAFIKVVTLSFPELVLNYAEKTLVENVHSSFFTTGFSPVLF